jgi:glycosyltransferase involved in cell wall biosynthesis
MMNRLLMVATVPETLNGFLAPFARHFRSKGWLVDGMARGISTNLESLETFDQVWDVEWSRNPLDPKNLLRTPDTIREAIEQRQYNLVHVHTPVAAFVTRYALKSIRKQGRPKVIYTAHGFHFYKGGSPLKNAIFLGLEKLGGQWTDHLIVINHEDEAAAKRFQLVPGKRVHYMPGIGVDLTHYRSDVTSLTAVELVRQEMGLTHEIPLFLCIAEFMPRKRHAALIQAFARIAGSKAHLALAGEGPLLEDIKTLADNLRIRDRVHFLGFRQDIPILIQSSVATILVSQQEGLPRSVMESFCLQVPVIGTAIRGVRDLLADHCGLLVNVGDVNALTNAMTWILDNPQEAREMGKRGRMRMADYDLHHIIDLHEVLYAEALGQKGRDIEASVIT